MEFFLFWFCSIAMVLGGVMMVAQRSAVVSAVWLVFTFVSAAGIFALLSAPFLAVMQVLVYAGAIMVLFMFVIMMLQGPVLDGEQQFLSKAMWPAVAIAPVSIIIMIVGYLRNEGMTALSEAPPEWFGTSTHIAKLIMGKYMLAFELISIVLLVAIIGALAIAKDERKQPWK